MSEKAMLSHEAGRHFYLNFSGGLLLSLFGEIHMRQGGDLQFISKFQQRHEEFSFYGL